MNRDIYNIAESYKQVLESEQPTREQLQATKNYLKAFDLPSDEVTVSQVSQNSLQMKLPTNAQSRAVDRTSNYKEVLGQLANAAPVTDTTTSNAMMNTPELSYTRKPMQIGSGDGVVTDQGVGQANGSRSISQKQQHKPYYFNTYQFPNLPETIEDEPGNPRKDDFNKPRQTATDLFNIFKSALSP